MKAKYLAPMTIRLSCVRKLFGSHAALNDVSLDVETGEFFVVLGPSGCGKSTLLRAIAGLEPVDGGDIHLADHHVAGARHHVAPEARNVGVVFQSYALWPHMSVKQNVAFPLETAKRAKTYVEARTASCLETVELAPYADRKPADLSGGQRQRVALARCLAQGARTVLMDEPLANLDPHLRGTMEEELAEFHGKSGATTLFITHDQREAMALADKVAVMWEGKILQADTPETLYERPACERVAGFIGRSSLVDVEVLSMSKGRAAVRAFGRTFEVGAAKGVAAGPARLLVRPEHLVPSDEGIAARVVRATYRGGYWEAHVSVEETGESLLMNLAQKARVGDQMQILLKSGWLLPHMPY